MTPEGRERFERFIARFDSFSQDESLSQWINPRLLGVPPAGSSSTENWIEKQQNLLKLVFDFITRDLRSALNEINVPAEPILNFFRRVIKILCFPKQFELFFDGETAVESAYQVLHDSIRIRLSQEMSKSLTELYVGASEAMDFLVERDHNGLYRVIDRYIDEINKLAVLRELAVTTNDVQQEIEQFYSIKSLDRVLWKLGEYWGEASQALSIWSSPSDYYTIAISSLLRQASYVSESWAENRRVTRAESIESGFSLDVFHRSRSVTTSSGNQVEEVTFQTVMKLPRISLSTRVVRDIFRQKEQKRNNTMEPSWINTKLTLPEKILSQLDQYLLSVETGLLEGLEAGNPYQESVCRNILDFYSDIKCLIETNELTVSIFYEKVQNFYPHLNSASAFYNKSKLIFKTICESLKQSLFDSVKNQSHNERTYHLNSRKILAELNALSEKYGDVPRNVDFTKFSQKDVARWRLEKREAIDYILRKNDSSQLNSGDIKYIREKYPCLGYTRFFWRRSEANKTVELVEIAIKELMWIDAGGYGDVEKNNLREKQPLQSPLEPSAAGPS